MSRELARLTGFRLFHNHVAIDFARSVFEFGTPSFWRVVDRARREVLEEAAVSGVDAIFTFVYGGGADDEFVRGVKEAVEAHGGVVRFVRLRCERGEILRRVAAKGRKEMGKLATKRGLRGLYSSHDLDGRIRSSRASTWTPGRRVRGKRPGRSPPASTSGSPPGGRVPGPFFVKSRYHDS